MNDKIIECKICNSKMKEYESNNPQPLLDSFEDRVCRDCNDYVTASRLFFSGLDIHLIKVISPIIVNIMAMASSLKESRRVFIEQYKEMKE